MKEEEEAKGIKEAVEKRRKPTREVGVGEQ